MRYSTELRDGRNTMHTCFLAAAYHISYIVSQDDIYEAPHITFRFITPLFSLRPLHDVLLAWYFIHIDGAITTGKLRNTRFCHFLSRR